MSTGKPKINEKYFENNDRDKNTDFTEVLNLKQNFDELNKQIEENPTDTMIDINKKGAIMMEYRTTMFLDHLEKANQWSYIDLNVLN